MNREKLRELFTISGQHDYAEWLEDFLLKEIAENDRLFQDIEELIRGRNV